MKYLSILVLIIISAITFISQNSNTGFEIGHQGYVSAQGLALSRNLSFQWPFFAYEVKRNDNGIEHYYPYNRFPPTTFILIKLATIFAGEKLSDEVYLARQTINIFFVLTLITSYFLLYKLSKQEWLSLAVICLAFSTHYLQLYNDLIFNDIPSLWGCLLLLLGIIEYRSNQQSKLAYIAIFIAIALGWQGLAVALTWAIIENIELLQKKLWQFKSFLKLLSTKILGIGLLLATIILSVNLISESIVMQKPMMQSGSLESILGRIGFSNDIGTLPAVAWHHFGFEQMYRVIGSTIPSLLLTNWPSVDKITGWPLIVLTWILFFLIISTVIWFIVYKKDLRTELLLISLSSLPWIIGLRYFVAFHDFQGIFYLSLSLVFYYGFFSILDKLITKLVIHRQSLITVLVILLSTLVFGSTTIYSNTDEEKNSKNFNKYTQDFDQIVQITGNNKKLYLAGNIYPFPMPGSAASFYTSGNFQSGIQGADYVLSLNKKYNTHNLTPENTYVYLFPND